MTRIYTDQTVEAVHQRMLDNMPDAVDTREGSVSYDLQAPAAFEVANAYFELDNVLELGFADTAVGSYLDRRAAEIGLTPRKAAVMAQGTVTLTGPVGTLIPAGTKVSNEASTPSFYLTKDAVVIPAGGSIDVGVTAEAGGTASNIAAGGVTKVVGNLASIVQVTNANSIGGGIDQETDIELFDRYTTRLSQPATSGNAAHYKQWAKEVAGIGDANVIPIWNGPGTVKVVLLTTAQRAPDSTLLAAATTYILDQAPIGANVTVAAALETAINVTATVTKATGKTAADVVAEFTPVLTAYLQSLAFKDPIVRYNQIGTLLINCDTVTDYSALTVNGGTANITIATGAVAVKGTVTIT
jgi:uncharacterized phage protein gp47/JayE